jgi:DNA polymerase-3 subunit alpha
MKYTSLHNHSDASPDGAGTVRSLVKEAKRLGMTALGLTDHGTLANAVSFWSECRDAEIKPILGMEGYLLYGGKRHHLTILSLNEQGFNNLVHLDSWSHAENYSGGYPLLTLDKIMEYNSGLYLLSGCPASALYKGEHKDAVNYVADLVDAVGKENVAMECMFVGTHDAWSRPIEYANYMNLPLVVTNDSHYPCRNQFHAHQTVCLSRHGYTYDSKNLWLKSGDEILKEGTKFVSSMHVREGLLRSNLIADKVESWDMRSAPSLPYIENVVEKISDALKDALKKDVSIRGSQRERVARLKYEFHILKDRGFLDYIFILWDIVSWAKKEGIYVGPGRGSGGGSYVLYLLGITAIDPIEYGLVFERFINPSRSDYPDVDVDFESDRRQEVMNYAQEKWGTIPIATYSCYSHKSAIHDIARTLKIPKTLEVEAADSEKDSEAFAKFINYNEHALSSYNTMLGQIRHRGKHAAGVIIPNRPVPIERAGDELVAAWAEGMNTKELSKVGIVKYDLLGLSSLSMLKKMGEVSRCPTTAIGWTYDEPKVFDLFCDGDVAGIFQWSGSDGIRELTKRVAPRTFYDLTTCNALYRPGALDAGTAEDYPKYMKSPRKLHPRIDQHLEKTYGVLCYQEQVMAVVAEVMGGDLAQADIARRLISKSAVGDAKWETEIRNLHYNFVHKGLLNGFTSELLDQLWQEIYTHSGYSYNLSHASAYTMISYQMAWYKVYHRAAFTVAVLQYDKANAQSYILDAIEHGLEIRMPHVNYSTNDYMLEGDKIYLPLSDVSFLGDKAADVLLAERRENGLFKSFEDFAKRVPKKTCNNRAKTMLFRIGAFSGFTDDPTVALDKFTEIPLGETYQEQLEILGYVIPSASLYAKMAKLKEGATRKDHERFAGFIRKVEKKKSVHGEYTVFHLSPSGSFWVREARDALKIGAFTAGSKNRYGHSKDVKTYKLVAEE